MLLTGEIPRLNALKYPHKAALHYEDKATLTWSQLDERSNRLANSLQQLGVAQGDRVALIARNRPNCVESLFACAKAGIVYAPLNYRFVGEEIVYVLQDSGAEVLLCDVEYADVVRGIRDRVPSLRVIVGFGEGHGFDVDYEDLLAVASGEQPITARPVDLDDVCWVCYTGGTTGMSKGVMLTHRNNYAQIANLAIADRVCHEDVYLVNGALFHVVLNMALPYWYVGGTVVIIDFTAEGCLDLIERHRVTKTVPVATMLNLLVELQRRAPRDLSSLELMGCGGAPISPDTVRVASEAFGCDFVQYFGQTEAAHHFTYLSAEDYRRGLAQDATDTERQRLLSGGRAQHLCLARIVDGDDETLGIGEVGEICGWGPNVMKGYWNKPELTQETLKGGWLHTGDLGYMDEDGYVYVVDRKKDMIVTGGENVFSSEVEKALYQHSDVLEAAVIGIPDARWGEAVTAFVVRRAGTTSSEEDLRSHCRGLISHYKVPKQVLFVDALPKAATGKIQKAALRDQYWTGQGRRVGASESS
ncbi:MAG: long-chain fatty acid--CoA ligase [Acidimicrobiales bacterium]|nr:long-chain fatty acid--CoA ligase [Acidimicrobiales bacterium]